MDQMSEARVERSTNNAITIRVLLFSHIAILSYGCVAWDMGVYQESNEYIAIWSRHLIH